MMKFFLLLIFTIISVSSLLFPPSAFADVLFPIPGYVVSDQPLIDLMINFIINLVAISIVCRFYLLFRNLKRIILASLIATFLGFLVDATTILPSEFLDGIISYSFNTDGMIRTFIFISIIFFVSFILLWAMYYMLIKSLFRIKGKKAYISSVILAFVTNPAIGVIYALLIR